MLRSGTAAWGGRFAGPRKMAVREKRAPRAQEPREGGLGGGASGGGVRWRIAGAKTRTKDLGRQRGREGLGSRWLESREGACGASTAGIPEALCQAAGPWAALLGVCP